MKRLADNDTSRYDSQRAVWLDYLEQDNRATMLLNKKLRMQYK